MSWTSIQNAVECTTRYSQRIPPVWPNRTRLTTTDTIPEFLYIVKTVHNVLYYWCKVFYSIFHATPFWHFFANFIWKKQKNIPKRAWIIKNKNKKRYPKNLVKELSWARFFLMEKKTEKKKNLKNKGFPKDISQRRCQILPSLNE